MKIYKLTHHLWGYDHPEATMGIEDQLIMPGSILIVLNESWMTSSGADYLMCILEGRAWWVAEAVLKGAPGGFEPCGEQML